MNDDQVLTIEEAAQFLKMTEKQVYELTRTRSQERMEYPFPAFSLHSKAKRSARVTSWLGLTLWRSKVPAG
jgi:predicted DNA-binding transcriptional regulator AlpA